MLSMRYIVIFCLSFGFGFRAISSSVGRSSLFSRSLVRYYCVYSTGYSISLWILSEVVIQRDFFRL